MFHMISISYHISSSRLLEVETARNLGMCLKTITRPIIQKCVDNFAANTNQRDVPISNTIEQTVDVSSIQETETSIVTQHLGLQNQLTKIVSLKSIRAFCILISCLIIIHVKYSNCSKNKPSYKIIKFSDLNIDITLTHDI